MGISISNLVKGVSRLKHNNIVYIFHGSFMGQKVYVYKEGETTTDCQIQEIAPNDESWTMASDTDVNPPKKVTEPIEPLSGLTETETMIQGLKRKKEDVPPQERIQFKQDKQEHKSDPTKDKMAELVRNAALNTVNAATQEHQISTYQKHLDQLFELVRLEGEMLKNKR